MAGTGEEVPKGEQEGGPVATSVPKGNTLEYYISLGAKAGLEGEQLTAFIKEQQGYEREERLRKRDYEKEMARIKLEGVKLEHEHKMYLAKQHEKELEAKLPSDPLSSSGVSVSDKSGIIPKLPKFNSDKDNLDAYLLRFERYAKVRGWSKENWAISLSSLLDGKALNVYSRLPPTFADDYDQLKKALLNSFNLDEDGFRAKYFSARQDKDESFAQYVTKVSNYFDRWVGLSSTPKTYENLRELLIREQCLHNSDSQLATFVRERKLDSLDSVIESATLYERAHHRKRVNPIHKNKNKLRSNDDASKDKSSSGQGQEQDKLKHQGHRFRFRNQNQNGSRSCHECGSANHFRKDCPKLALGNAAVDQEVDTGSKADDVSE